MPNPPRHITDILNLNVSPPHPWPQDEFTFKLQPHAGEVIEFEYFDYGSRKKGMGFVLLNQNVVQTDQRNPYDNNSLFVIRPYVIITRTIKRASATDAILFKLRREG